MTKVKFSLLFFLFFLLAIQIKSQNKSQKDSINVHNVIIALFDGMRKGDSSKVHETFHKKVRMFTSYSSKIGEQKPEEGKLSHFLNAVGSPHENIWDERISNIRILIDDGLAQVWTDYAFYIADKFSYCGVDSFQLVKDKNKKWKIINLMDTRRVVDCISKY